MDSWLAARWNQVLVVLLMTCLVVAFQSGPAGAYERGRKWAKASSSWPLYRVYVDYTSLPSSWRDVSFDSRMEWNNSGASNLYFYYDDSSRGHKITMGAYGKTGWLGSTLQIGSPLTDVDTQLNSTYPMTTGYPSSTQYDGTSVVTHELGHWLELYDLDSKSGYPTMYYGVAPGTTWMRSLTSDDIAGIQAIYGKK